MDVGPEPKPLKDGLLQMEPFALLGAQCQSCGIMSFPARDFCPSCFSNSLKLVPCATGGVIFSFTTIHIAPPGRKTPYDLAYVDLDDGIRVLSQVRSDVGSVSIGDRVILRAEPVVQSDASVRVGYIFEVTDHLNKECRA